MADTIVNTPGGERSSDMAGWVVALIILLAVIIGGMFFFQRFGGRAPAPQSPGANVNVTLPTGSGQEGGAAQ